MNYLSISCRGIACVASKYICVGSLDGVIVLSYAKNTFNINETLQGHSQPVTSLSGIDAVNNKVWNQNLDCKNYVSC